MAEGFATDPPWGRQRRPFNIDSFPHIRILRLLPSYAPKKKDPSARAEISPPLRIDEYMRLDLARHTPSERELRRPPNAAAANPVLAANPHCCGSTPMP